jgi:ornithine carbamoyltransferase
MSTSEGQSGMSSGSAGPRRHFLTVASLSAAEFRSILDLSSRMKAEPDGWRDALPGRRLAMIFDKPSTRTRVSFEAAAVNLGMHPLLLRPDELQVGRGEPPQDTARVLNRLVDALAWRTFSQAKMVEFASFSTIPVVNALTDEHHPCQALADCLTLEEQAGGLAGRKLAYVGDGNNVAHSLIEAAALCGVHLVLATPEGYAPDPAILASARARAPETGARIDIVRDPREAVANSDAVYTDTWISMGMEADREAREQAFAGYLVDDALMDTAKPGAVFLHCLPAYRGKEVTGEVLDGPRSRVWDEAENRLWTEQAMLYWLITGDLAGERHG